MSEYRVAGVRRSTGGRSCSNCLKWLPHAIYPMVGYCSLWDFLTLEDEVCDEYSPRRYPQGEYFWCSDCSTKLTSEEAEAHAKMSHGVYRGAYVDPDVIDELYEAF